MKTVKSLNNYFSSPQSFDLLSSKEIQFLDIAYKLPVASICSVVL